MCRTAPRDTVLLPTKRTEGQRWVRDDLANFPQAMSVTSQQPDAS